MKQKELEKLKKALILWLQKNELYSDVTFYEIEDWRKRGERFHNESEMVITVGSGFGDVLNGYSGEEIYEEFEELVEQFGFYLELGNAWNGGFYEIPDYNFERKKELEENLLMFFTGVTRYAHKILEEQVSNTKNEKINPDLNKIKSMVDEGKEILSSDISLDSFGLLLDDACSVCDS